MTIKVVNVIAIGLLAFSCSCSQQTQTTNGDRSDNPNPPTQLAVAQTLFTGRMPFFTNMVDLDGDSKPELIVGSKGHRFADDSPEILVTKSWGADRCYVSVFPNRSSDSEILFGDPYRPNIHGIEGQIPIG